MMTRYQFSFTLAAATMIAPLVARADLPERPPSEPEHRTASLPSSAHAESPDGTDEAYPTSLIDRPLTLPKSTLELAPALERHVFPWGYFGGSVTLLRLGASYGISDDLELGVMSAIALDPEILLPDGFRVDGAYAAYRGELVQIAPRIETWIVPDAAGGVPVMTLGADTRLVVNDSMFLLLGHSLVPIRVAENSLSVDLNLGVGLQATSSLALLLDAQVASIPVRGAYLELTHLGNRRQVELTGLYGLSERADLFVQAGLLSFSAGLHIRL